MPDKASRLREEARETHALVPEVGVPSRAHAALSESLAAAALPLGDMLPTVGVIRTVATEAPA